MLQLVSWETLHNTTSNARQSVRLEWLVILNAVPLSGDVGLNDPGFKVAVGTAGKETV